MDAALALEDVPISTLSTPPDVASVPDLSKHEIFFFPDGNITFIVEDTLYCLYRHMFLRHSPVFVAEFIPDDSEDDGPIELDGVKRHAFDNFLSILYPSNFAKSDVEGVEGWATVLHLSTLWGFKSIRELAIRSLATIGSCVDKVVFGHKYDVEEFLLPGYTELCQRDKSLTFEEGRRIGLKYVITIAHARQELQLQHCSRSLAGTASGKCLSCNSNDAFTITYNAFGLRANPTVDADTCRFCRVKRGSITSADISQQVKQLLPHLSPPVAVPTGQSVENQMPIPATSTDVLDAMDMDEGLDETTDVVQVMSPKPRSMKSKKYGKRKKKY